ncbi:MAG: adenylate/guanylate cyclase domain-containing protein [Bdellovibrionota bacterium]
MRIPISMKLIIMTVSLLLGVTIPIAIQSSDEFQRNSVQRENAINRELAESRARQLENVIMNLVEKITLSARILIKPGAIEASAISDEFKVNFNNDSDLISLEVYLLDGISKKMLTQQVKEKALVSFGLTADYIAKLRDVRDVQKFPFNTLVEDKGKVVLLNSSGTQTKEPSMITLGVPLYKDKQGRITHVAVAEIQLSVFQKPFEKRSASSFFVTDREGILLAHSNFTHAVAKKNMATTKIFEYAQKSASPSAVLSYRDLELEKDFLGAYAKTSFGATVFSTIETEKVLAPAHKVRLEAFKIAGYFLSITLFLVFIVSLSLTSPLENLAGLIALVSKGNFNVKASSKIKGYFKDEVTELATAFDNMIEGLKERDKVKNLFNKFHGSSITDDLMKGDLSLGGSNKDVVIFFSDIRGFTAFSEKRPPEEVVEMLNEYFGVMVGIINKNHGVVDKFIGDAIMAVWGAPKSSPKDAHYAVSACLEMRKALNELNTKRIVKNQPAINIGMGLHSGRAISGTIGSNERMEYTVIGNTVNTGSRIEASTKAFGADLLISETVFEKIGDAFKTEYVGSAEVKGRSEPLKLFKVRAYKTDTGHYVEVKTPYSDYEPEKADKVKISA